MLRDKNITIVENKGKYEKIECPADLSPVDKFFIHKLKNKIALMFQCGFVINFENVKEINENEISTFMAENKIPLIKQHRCINTDLSSTIFTKSINTIKKEVES